MVTEERSLFYCNSLAAVPRIQYPPEPMPLPFWQYGWAGKRRQREEELRKERKVGKGPPDEGAASSRGAIAKSSERE